MPISKPILTRLMLSSLLALSSYAGTAAAKVSAEEAEKLGNELTPVGATKAGNADGSIPAWDPWPQKGKLSGEDLVAENFPDTIGKILAEKPKFAITADNYKDYADRLTRGHKALFELYPDYKMKVYPTHRNVGYPEKVFKFSKQNATTTTLDGCNDCLGAFDFHAELKQVIAAKCREEEIPPDLLHRIERCFGDDFDGDGAIG